MLQIKRLSSPLARYGLLVLGAVVAVGVAYLWAYGRGKDACETDYQAALAETLARQQAIVDAQRERGDAIAARLAAKERELSSTKQEYLTYANAITGHCPGTLGVLVGAASGANALPPAASEPADAPPPVAAALVAANVSENYARFGSCYAQLNALIDWHEGTAKDMK